MLGSAFSAEGGEVTRHHQEALGEGGHGVVGAASTGQRTATKREQLYALKDKISDQSNDSEKKTAVSVSCTTLQSPPMSQHNEGENVLMAKDGPSRLNSSGHSPLKSASTSTPECLVINSLRETEDDIALSNSTSTSGIAAQMKNIYSSDGENEDEASTWSSILDEANRLVCLHEKTSNSLFSSAKAEARRSQKGERDKAKPKFSIRFQTHQKELCFHGVVKTENEESFVAEGEPSIHDIHHRISAHSMAELLEELQQGNKKLQESDDLSAKAVSPGKRGARYSMSTLLEDLEKDSPLKWPSKLVRKSKCKVKVRKAQIVGRRAPSHLGNRSLNDEDAPEPVGSRTSSEDEDNDKNLMPTTMNIKGQTMADIFQEVFSVSVTDVGEVPLATKAGIGYYGRLQQIMQRDKDNHMEFLKQLQSSEYLHRRIISNFSLCESKCINVKILSRLLDAKLTVCCCLLADKAMSSQTGDSPKNYEDKKEATVKTIIFSSKICRNVELEVGNFICIHPPWNYFMESAWKMYHLEWEKDHTRNSSSPNDDRIKIEIWDVYIVELGFVISTCFNCDFLCEHMEGGTDL